MFGGSGIGGRHDLEASLCPGTVMTRSLCSSCARESGQVATPGSSMSSFVGDKGRGGSCMGPSTTKLKALVSI